MILLERTNQNAMAPHKGIEHVQVQTVSWCNRTCAFCPSGTFEIERKFMSEAVYARILDELCSIGFDGRFSPYLMNEPLIDRRMPHLIEMARAALPGSRIFLSTNGDALTPQLGTRLYAAGLDRMLVNHYDKDNTRLERLVGITAEIATQVPRLRQLRQPAFPDLINDSLGDEHKIIAVFDASSWTIDQLTNRAGNVPNAAVPAEPLKATCYRPFKQLYIRYNGDVVLCCCDWKGEVVFGNIVDDSLAAIFDGTVANRYREHLARRDRRLKLCSACDFHGEL